MKSRPSDDDAQIDFAHRVTFFGPDRPVQGGTVYTRSAEEQAEDAVVLDGAIDPEEPNPV